MKLRKLAFLAGISLLTYGVHAQTADTPAAADASAGPYKVLQTVKVGGDGGFDYVDCDPDTRHLYVVRSGRGRGTPGRLSIYDMDAVKLISEIPNVTAGHGVAVDTKSGHAFTSSNPVVEFDTKTLAVIKTIDVPDGANPDGIFFEPFTESIYVLSHSSPNVVVIKGSDGTVAGTIDLGGGPEEGASDGKGHAYIDIEEGNNVAVVDTAKMTCTAHYDLQGKGAGPGGLALDADNGIIFSYCHDPAVCVILSAADGKILDTLPTGSGVDAAEWNPATMEAFSSNGGSGTLTVIKENSPTSFAVEQELKTMPRAKCSTLDTKTNEIFEITAQYAAATRPSGQQAGGAPGGGAPGAAPGGGGRRGRGAPMIPGSFTIVVVGKGS